MTVGWAIVAVVVAVAVAIFGRALVGGFVQAAREQVRRDLIALGKARSVTVMLAGKTGEAGVAFAAPGVDGREFMVGWLWWRTDVEDDGSARSSMGWALTYRRARRAAGMPVRMRARDPEFIIARKAPAPEVQERMG
ncbi:hypothetical protein [Streptomyces goshikiensis]|uniref:hypothetical protein n=1 Tax=Streptomyces goshikiensis TaxID=1942 RepID=UPI0036B5D493